MTTQERMSNATPLDDVSPYPGAGADTRHGGLRLMRGSMAGELPTIFFVGPPRTATTWLHSIFKDRMSLPRLKETYFFDKLYSRGFDWYLSHSDAAAGHAVRAEMAPSYFFSEDARRRIAEAAGAARIVVTLRDPVARLYSLYKMRYSNGVFRWSFEQACVRDAELAPPAATRLTWPHGASVSAPETS